MDINKLERIAIHCPTKDKAIALLKFFHTQGWSWCNEIGLEYSYTKGTLWNDYAKNTCYEPFYGEYSPLSYYQRNGYKIISVDSFLNSTFKYLI